MKPENPSKVVIVPRPPKGNSQVGSDAENPEQPVAETPAGPQPETPPATPPAAPEPKPAEPKTK